MTMKKEQMRWFLFRYSLANCGECDKKPAQYTLTSHSHPWIGVGGIRSESIIITKVGDSIPYLCEHGKLCYVRVLGKKGFHRYPRKDETDHARKEWGDVCQD